MSPKRLAFAARLRIDWYLLLIVGMVALASLAPARGAAAPVFEWATRIAIGGWVPRSSARNPC